MSNNNKIRVPDYQRRKASLFGHSQINGFQREKFHELPEGPLEEEYQEPIEEPLIDPKNQRTKITLKGMDIDQLRLRKPNLTNRGDLDEMIKPRFPIKKTRDRTKPPPKQNDQVDVDKVYSDYQNSKIMVDHYQHNGAPRPLAKKILPQKESTNEQWIEEEIYLALVQPGKKNLPKQIINHKNTNGSVKQDQTEDLHPLPSHRQNKKDSDPNSFYYPEDPNQTIDFENYKTLQLKNAIVSEHQFVQPRPLNGTEYELTNEERRTLRLNNMNDPKFVSLKHNLLEQENTKNQPFTNERKPIINQPLLPTSLQIKEDETWQTNVDPSYITKLFDPNKKKTVNSIVDEEWIDQPISVQEDNLRTISTKNQEYNQSDKPDSFGNQNKISTPFYKGIRNGSDFRDLQVLDKSLHANKENKTTRLQYRTVSGNGNKELNDPILNGDPLEFLPARFEKISIQSKLKLRDPSLAVAPSNRPSQKDPDFKLDKLQTKKVDVNENVQSLNQLKQQNVDLVSNFGNVNPKAINPRERSMNEYEKATKNNPFHPNNVQRIKPVETLKQNPSIPYHDVETFDEPWFTNQLTKTISNNPKNVNEQLIEDVKEQDLINPLFNQTILKTERKANPVFDTSRISEGFIHDPMRVSVRNEMGDPRDKSLLSTQGIGVAEFINDAKIRNLNTTNKHEKLTVQTIAIEEDKDVETKGHFVKKPIPPKVSVTVKGDKNTEATFLQEEAIEKGKIFTRPIDKQKEPKLQSILEPGTELTKDVLSTRERTNKTKSKLQKRSVKEKDYVLVFETDTDTERFIPTSSTKKEPKKRTMSFQSYQ